MAGPITAVFFDQDGVIADTERDGHRVAFNETFREFGFEFQWGVNEYHALLQIAGGKERIKYYLRQRGISATWTPEQEDDRVRQMHKVKTEKFIGLIRNGTLPLRPGVERFMREINRAGLVLGVCTTANENAARAIATNLLAGVKLHFLLAGDAVRQKKPDPEIYRLAIQTVEAQPEECLVVEDSRNGLLAGKSAGAKVLVTTNPYTEHEDLREADLIVTCLGDPEGERGRLVQGGEGLEFDGVVRLEALQAYFAVLQTPAAGTAV